jgi:probable rRNA maturation factor
MPSTITILRKDFNLVKINKNILMQKISKAIEILGLGNIEITIVFESKNKMRNLKNKYLGIDEITDVLSFESGEINPESGYQILGDVLIASKKAMEQAKENHISFDFEILSLSIHGLLHLLGYDHSSKLDEKIMFALQDSLLGEIYET